MRSSVRAAEQDAAASVASAAKGPCDAGPALDLAAEDVSWVGVSLRQIYARRKDSLVNWTVTNGTAAPGSSVAWDTVHVSVGVTHACAILRDFSVLCWGANTHGELGDGTTANRDQAVRVLHF